MAPFAAVHAVQFKLSVLLPLAARPGWHVQGTYSLGGKEAVCQTCPNLGAGFTTAPKLAATSIASCVCRPGFGFTEVGTCKRCPANTYSSGSDRADCSPCPFGTTSAAGATSKEECRASPQACPIGQWAPEDAVSKEQCMCYPGFGGACVGCVWRLCVEVLQQVLQS